jgi:hypothetical protein
MAPRPHKSPKVAWRTEAEGPRVGGRSQKRDTGDFFLLSLWPGWGWRPGPGEKGRRGLAEARPPSAG